MTNFRIKVNGKVKAHRKSGRSATSAAAQLQSKTPNGRIEIEREVTPRPTKPSKVARPKIPVYIVANGRAIKVRSV